MRPGAASFALLLLSFALGACGSGGEVSSTGAPGSGVSEAAKPRVAPLKVSGTGSAQFHVKGGDNSIQDYGEEAGKAELRQAAEAFHAYVTALATEEWADACSQLAPKEVSNLEQVTTASSPLRGKGCAQTLAKLFGEVTAAEGREATAVDAESLRRKGALGFLIYVGAGGKAYFTLLERQGGRWTVSDLNPTPLP